MHIDLNSLKHFSICFILSTILGLFGAGLSLGASVTKEWCDKTFYGHFCLCDLLFDFVGILAGIALHLLILKNLIIHALL